VWNLSEGSAGYERESAVFDERPDLDDETQDKNSMKKNGNDPNGEYCD
jgi:hypothetical protein